MISFFGKDFIQDSHVQIFKSQITENEHKNLKGNILIVSDRLSLLAWELLSYLKKNTEANIIGVVSNMDAMKVIDTKILEYVIIVGYLENEENYEIIEMVRSHSENVKTIQWAMLDSYIKTLSMKYNIHFQFDRIEPARDFVNYLLSIKDKNDKDIDSKIV